jgi:NAD(P)-dependent dehydrogenase (short-subunit alcohol dehydrogenase family)
MSASAIQHNDQVAVVTGAASGIGRAAALAFAQSGVKVVLADISVDAGESVAAEIKKQTGVLTSFVKCDVSKSAEVERMVRHAVEHFGRIDYAFNNAGTEGMQATTAECSEENFDRTVAIDLKGTWLCMKYEIPQMLKQGGGAIVNSSSIAGLVGFPNIPAYVAAKHGVIGLTKTAALEYAKSNIRVNAVCPGVIHTPMVDRFVGGHTEVMQALTAGEPIGRIGEPSEIAEAVLYLCSARASFLTGVALPVDGGWVAQ